MKFFKKSTQPTRPIGRQRPTDSEAEGRRARAFSYYTQRSDNAETLGRGTDHIVERSGRARAVLHNRLILTTGLIVCLGIIGYSLILNDNPRVIKVNSGGSAYFMQDSEAYVRTIHKTLTSSILNSNKLTVNTNGIATDLKQNFPEIADVDVVRPLIGQSLLVRITPSVPSFILTTTDSKAFLLDKNGRALVSTSQIVDNGELSVLTIHDASGLPVKLGSQALPRSIIEFTETVTHILAQQKVSISSLTLPRATSELDVAIGGTPYFVKFNLQGDAVGQAGTFLSTKARLERDKITPAAYIDVRVSERAYYK